MGDCIFCAIVAGEAPAKIVKQLPSSIAIIPLGPVVDGHILVIPQQHVTDFTDSPDVTATAMHDAASLARDLGGAYNLITSKGAEATQTVFHLHVHLVPRREGDKLALPWTGQTTEDRVRALADEMAQNDCKCECCREALDLIALRAVLPVHATTEGGA